MKLDPVTRRLFLTGGGLALAAPFLPSLLPRGARAQAAPGAVRYIQVMHPYGQATRHFYGSLADESNEEVEPYVSVRRLSDIDGALSPMLAEPFSGLKDKIALVAGLEVMTRNANHNFCFPTCASGYAEGLDGDSYPPASGQPSLDVLMAESGKVYTSDVPMAQRLLVLNPVETDGYTDTRSFSWRSNGAGAIEMIRPTKTSLGLRDLLAAGFEGSGEATPAIDGNEELLMNALQEDYRRVVDNSRLGAEDKERFEAYMALVQDATRPASRASGTLACDVPEALEEVDVNAKVTNQIRLLTAAMMCDLTRVASLTLGMSEGYDVRHTEHHDVISVSDDAGLVDDFARCGRWVGELVQSLDAVPDGQGTLLDNSAVYWGAQFGNIVIGDAHRTKNMPVMVAGGAGGQLQTGYYIDYRKEGHLKDDKGRGIPLNNLLVTLMNCMGLSSADYETSGQPGYGYYLDEFFEDPLRADPARYNTTDGRRSPLPFFYRGEVRG